MDRHNAGNFPHLSTGKLPLLAHQAERVICRTMDDGIKKRIEQRLHALDITPRAASIKAGGSPDLIRGLLRGRQRNFRGDNLSKLAEVLGVSANWLLTGDDVGSPSAPTRLVPVVGYVGAGAEIFSIDDHEKGGGLDEVEVPIPGMSLSSVAVRVRGASMEPAYYNGDLIFYDRNDNGDLMHLIGKECVVSLKDGRKFIKTLKRRSNGDWFLHSYNAEPILDIVIDWAAKVKVIQRS